MHWRLRMGSATYILSSAEALDGTTRPLALPSREEAWRLLSHLAWADSSNLDGMRRCLAEHRPTLRLDGLKAEQVLLQLTQALLQGYLVLSQAPAPVHEGRWIPMEPRGTQESQRQSRAAIEAGLGASLAQPSAHAEPEASPAPAAPVACPSKERIWYGVRVLDPLGRPVEGLPLLFAAPGAERSVSTDGEGEARTEDAADALLIASLADVGQARQLLEPRWAEGKDPDLEKNAEHTLYRLGLSQPSLTLLPGQLRSLVILPSVTRICVTGMYFESEKCFLLPCAMDGIRRLKQIYEEHDGAKVLVVGHADTRGEDRYNMDLSLDRAEAMAAYLTDQVDRWLPWYQDAKPLGKRWGTREDQYMLSALPEGQRPYFEGEIDGVKDARYETAVRRLQTDAGLKVDGIAGPKTREALIQRYMAIDGTTLPEGVELVTHGCGENFPEVPSAPDPSGKDKQEEEAIQAKNRRVELFMFRGAIVPPPPGRESPRGSPQYPIWRMFADRTIDISIGGGVVTSGAIRIWLHDHLGQRMGANPASPDPVEQSYGAPYRLEVPGEIRVGYANPEGLLEEYQVPWQNSCLLQWGKREWADEQIAAYEEPPREAEVAERYFLYQEVIFLDAEPRFDGYVTRALQNLGYQGSEDEQRAAFERDYQNADDAAIDDIHRSGLPRTRG